MSCTVQQVCESRRSVRIAPITLHLAGAAAASAGAGAFALTLPVMVEGLRFLMVRVVVVVTTPPEGDAASPLGAAAAGLGDASDESSGPGEALPPEPASVCAAKICVSPVPVLS